jgi:hypothetical protein
MGSPGFFVRSKIVEKKRAPEQPHFDDGLLKILDYILKRLKQTDSGLHRRFMLAAALAIWSVSEAYGWPPLP